MTMTKTERAQLRREAEEQLRPGLHRSWSAAVIRRLLDECDRLEALACKGKDNA